MREITISLSGQEFTLQELDIEANAAWRKKFEAAIGPLFDTLQGLDNITLDTAADLQRVLGPLRQAIMHSPSTITDLLFAYSPELAKARASGLKLYESELFGVFVEALKLAYPFGALLEMINSVRATGSAPKPSTPTPPKRSQRSGRTHKRG